MKEYKLILEELKASDLFKQWALQHPTVFLSHFFAPLSASFEFKSEWEIGFFDPETEKITVFNFINDQFAIKPADDVFNKESSKVEPLALEKIKLNFSSALEIFKENVPKKFPQELLGEGFIILQTFKDDTFWNFTFITKKLKFINLKVDVDSGQVIGSEEVNLVHQE